MMKLFVVYTFLLIGYLSAEKPNVIMIYVDDLGYADLSCQGSKDIRTPNIDQWASEGVRFTAAYTSSPQCGPSRAGLMTGLNQMRFGYAYNKRNHGIPGPDVLPIMPEVMKKAGYRTSFIGKWHISGIPTDEANSHEKTEFAEEAPLIDEKSTSLPWKRGFDEAFFFNGKGYFPYSDGKFHAEPFEFIDGKQVQRDYGYDKSSNRTDIHTDRAIDFLRRQKSEIPFFMYLAYNCPHGPLQATEKDLEANRHIKDGKRRIFAAMMTRLDENIGRLMKNLKQLNQFQNTMIVFMSDNGGTYRKNASRCDPLTGQKGDLYDGGVRTPCIITYPERLPKGTIYENPISSLNFLPTFAALAGVELDKSVDYDGVNLMPYIRKDNPLTSLPNKEIYWYWDEFKAVRINDYKWVDLRANKTKYKKANYDVFDFSKSIEEKDQTSLKSPEKLKSMEQQFEAYWAKRLNQYTSNR